MHEMAKKQKKVLIEHVINELKKRNIEGFYAEDKLEALKICKELLKDCKSVGCGGSETIQEIGLVDELRKGNYEFLDRADCKIKTPEQVRELTIKMYDADAFVGSVNAITDDGILVNIDGNSNRISAYAFGPKKLILVVGVQKIVKDVDAAIKRARNEAATINCVRLNKNTPCTKVGYCMDCKCDDTICCQFLITRYSRHNGRIKIVLVNEELGF